MDQISRKNNNMQKKSGLWGQNIKIILIFIIGFILGSLVTPIVTSDRINLLTDKKSENKEETAPLQSINSVNVSNQLAGNRVLLDSIILSESGWAAVHEDINGNFGNALGAQRFDAGSNSGYVDLLRNTETGNIYYVILYKDNGDDKFDLKSDTVFVNDSEEVILDTFETIMFDRKIN